MPQYLNKIYQQIHLKNNYKVTKMQNFQDEIRKAKKGEIVTIYKELGYTPDPVDYFAKISGYGKKKNCLLLESADIIAKYGEKSLGTADPCLKLVGKKEEFEIIALNDLGIKFIKELKGDLNFCDEIIYETNLIKGRLTPKRKAVNESERLNLKTHIDIIRKVAFKFKPAKKEFIPYAGLFGSISYDFIDQFEDLPESKEDILQDPDYELYFVDNLFLMDYKKKKTFFIANALITDGDKEKIYEECMKKIGVYEKNLDKEITNIKKREPVKQEIISDTSKEEFIETVKKLKGNILAGDVFQVVPSRTIITNYNAEPLDIYKSLRDLNPSPYMFYINNQNGTFLGASPEMFLKVEGDKEKIVEIRPIAGTKPRGIINGKVDADLDSRYEAELKIDKKELAEHTMLIDLARNDVARISKPGTRYVDEPFIVEKYSHVQHLVSNVSGVLKDNLDALHAYLASMNMGTLTGAPKVEAMKLIRLVEKTKRGFYGGAVGYITPSNDFDSCIVIRSMRLKNDKAYIRAGAGIVYDSVPEKEYDETDKKAGACLKAIQLAGGLT